MKKIAFRLLACAAVARPVLPMASVVNPDCTAEKAAKSAAAKATVGVGGRCSPAEAAKDSRQEGSWHRGQGADSRSATSKDRQHPSRKRKMLSKSRR